MHRDRLFVKGLKMRVLEPGSPEQLRLVELEKTIANARLPMAERRLAAEQAWPLRYEPQTGEINRLGDATH